MHAWLKKHPGFLDLDETIPEDPGKYLRGLLASSSSIDIRGLRVGSGEAHRFPIEELFITLTTSVEVETPDAKGAKPSSPGASSVWTRVSAWFSGPAAGSEPAAAGKGRFVDRMPRQTVPLQAALSHRRLVIIGDPGSGKSTFLKRALFELCRSLVEGSASSPFPIPVRLADLHEFIQDSRRGDGPRTSPERAVWLSRYLTHASKESEWGLSEAFFRRLLENESCLILMDGLDEAPGRPAREALSKLVEQAALAYPKCSIVVTTRPAAYVDDVVLPGFTHARIDPLDDAAIESFLARWCDALYSNDPAEARRHREELLGALAARPEIRRMARNPVMLTALAVMHWNEARLPEQRADLYESIIRWLSRSRASKPERPTAERAVVLIQEVALAMQNHKDGRQTQVSRRWAAEAIAGEWTDANPAERIRQAERFLDAEELDSGIVVRRGGDIAFWHLTFQEFLAARAIASRTDADQRPLLFIPKDKMYRPEWREAVLLFAGILHQAGRAKVDAFVSDCLESLGSKPSLTEQARAAGLLGGMLRDLAPVQYQVRDPRYEALLERVLVILDTNRARMVPVEARIEAAEALGQAGDPRLEPDHPDRWVEIPEGTFRMGAQKNDERQPNYDAEAYDDESPVHDVRLDSFAISRYPVTVAEYQAFIDDNGYQQEKFWTEGGFGKSSEPENWDSQRQFPNRPVVSVSWFEAAAYARWAGCRLPTEAQWERAARGTAGRRYPWGSNEGTPDRLNYSESNVGRPTPVGIYPDGATPDGIFDLAGNVWEWCNDWYGDYTAEPCENPAGPTKGEWRVGRGGSWDVDARGSRASYRGDLTPEVRDVLIGFRVVRVRTP